MHLQRLTLRGFRNFAVADLPLDAGTTIVQGRNAQGKTNILEAIYYLVTGRSFRARQDREVLPWGAAPDAVATIEGDVARRASNTTIQVIVGAAGKRVLGDGKPLDRLARLWGRLNAVLFTPADLALVQGGPALRRRFLDVELAQIDAAYLSHAQRFDVALRQRNAILRGHEHAPRATAVRALLPYRDTLLESGAAICAARARYLEALGREAARCYAAISGDTAERLSLSYVSTLAGERGGADAPAADRTDAMDDEDCDDGNGAGRVEEGEAPIGADERAAPNPDEAATSVAARAVTLAADYAAQLDAALDRDLRQGQTSVGPHRDDILVALDGRDARDFASQGQQRSCVLALRLAEIEPMRAATGETPILLFDDIVSELDAARRAAFFAAIPPGIQLLVTATDAELLRPLAPAARVIRVNAGEVKETNN